MRKISVALAAAVLLGLAGCGGDSSASDESAAASPPAASPTVDPKEYAGKIVAAFRETLPVGSIYTDVPTSDWRAFASAVEDLTPPEGEDLRHERVVAGFEAFAEAREEADRLCAGVTWTDPGWGPCSTARFAVGDAWTAALDRAYEIPGVSWGTLLN